MDFQSFQMNMEILSDVLGMTSFLATVLLYMSIEVAGITSLMKDRKKLFYIKEQYEKNKVHMEIKSSHGKFFFSQ